MDREVAAEVLCRLHSAQNAFYGGDDSGPLEAVLSHDVIWSVPGDNAIAGSYVGVEEVLDYMRRRRAIAEGTFQLHPKDLLTGDGDLFGMHTDGSATIGGDELSWSTIGLYRLDGDRVARCWLLPLDQSAFDRVWRQR